MTNQTYQSNDPGPALDPDDDVFVFPASSAQQRLWVIEQMSPGLATYNLPVAVRLEGPLDSTALEQSLQQIVARHEALRTIFTVEEAQPAQVVLPELRLPLERVDLALAAEDARDAQIQRLVNSEVQRPFNLREGPLLRATLLRLAADEHILILTLHHIIADGWSIGVLLRELSTIYGALVGGHEAALPELALQYADWTIWQREWLDGAAVQEQLAYWQQQLAGATTTLELPADRARPPVQSFRGATAHFRLPAPLTQQIKTLSQREGVTLFTTLLAAFQTLLYRLSGQDDVLVGAPSANRARAQTEDVIGFFVNMLVLRASFVERPSFSALLQQQRERTLQAFSHQDLPFEQIVEGLDLERSLSRNPLFQTVLVLRDDLLDGLDLPGLRLSPVAFDTGTTKFDLTLDLWEHDDALHGRAEYSTDLFDATTIARLVAQFERVLEGVVAHPTQPVDRLPLITTQEQRQIAAWSSARTEYPRTACIHKLFEAQVTRSPDAVAVVAGDTQLSYAELNRRANQLAHHLRSLGVGPEQGVGICLSRDPDLLVAILGVLKAGAAYVPIDPRYPHERRAFMLHDAQASIVLTDSRLRDAVQTLATPICLDAEWPTIAALPADNQTAAVSAQNMAYLMYTSGSTGQPKGVAVPHQAVVRLVQNTTYAHFGPDERVLQLAPLAFDASTFEVWGALLNGATLVLCPEERPSLDRIAQLIHEQQITTLWLTAGLFHQMVDTHLDALRSLHQLLAGGDVLSVTHVQRAARALRQGRVINGYGPTENTTFTCCYSVADPNALATSVPIGGPISNTEVYVLDAALQPVGVGVPGELYIGGDGLARGYHNQPALTAARFVPNPFSHAEGTRPGARLYRSGDWVRWRADGTLDFLGRIDGQIKLRGFRIELGEVEALLRQHPQVQDAAAALRPGPGDVPQLVAYVVEREPRTKNQEPRDGDEGTSEQGNKGTREQGNKGAHRPKHQELGDEAVGSQFLVLGSSELRSFLKERLPEHMIPAAFVVLPTLPLTPNGKLDRRALPQPPTLREDERAPYVAPRNEAEQRLAAIWADVLKQEHVGIYDNFFELGGHSLLATQLVLRIREEFGNSLTLQAVFESTSIAALAQQIAADSLASAQPQHAPIPTASRSEALPLSFPQQRLWLLDQLEPQSTRYNLAFAIRLRGPLDVAALRRAFEMLVRRHEVLRTTFAQSDSGVPIQMIQPAQPWSLPSFDTTAAAVSQQAVAEAQQSFDLERGPLMRTKLLRIAPDEHVLLLGMHHIISDGWSMSLLYRELSALYADDQTALAPLPIQYADFAVWQRQQLHSDTLAPQIAYWKQRLQGSATLELPTDRPRPPVQSYRGEVLYLDLPDDLSRALQRFSDAHGVTLFMTLLAGFQVVLHRLSGQDDIAVGTPIAGRTHRQIEHLIGFFVNTLVLRTDLGGNPRFVDLLQQVRATALEAYQHQDLPFELLVDVLDVARDVSRSPLFQVMFALQNVEAGAINLPGIQADQLDIAAHSTKFDLSVYMQQTEHGLRAMVEYSSDLFDAATIGHFMERYILLLRGVIDAPEQRIAALPLITEAERAQIDRWNATARSYPSATLPALVEAQAARTPDAIAVRYEATTLSYRALDQRANQVTHALRPLLSRHNPLVAVCLDRSPELVVVLLGLLKAGGAFVPLDPGYPADRLQFMLEDAQAAALITERSLAGRLPDLPGLPVLLIDGPFGATLAELPATAPDQPPAPNDLAYMIYTSGSTGQPKGALNTHEGIVNRLLWGQERFKLRADDRVLQKTPLSFDVSVWELFWPLIVGAELVLARPGGHADPTYLRETIIEAGITTIQFVPSLLQLFLDQPDIERCTSLRRVICSGEAVPWELQQRFFARLPVELHNLYGPTEAAIEVTAWQCRADSARQLVPIGHLIANLHAYILDAQMQPVPIGVAGELYLGGVGVGLGYHRRAALSAERFLPDPFSTRPGARMYRTGDRARYLADGAIDFLGRLDNQIKLRGVRIELGEVSAHLQAEPGVREAVTVVRPGAGGTPQLVSYITLLAGTHELSGTLLREQLRAQMPEVMVPAAVIVLPALPLTPNGKLDMAALPTADLRRDEAASYVAPVSTLERDLALLWAEVLGVERVGVSDNFFDIGGNSLLLARVRSRMLTELGHDIAMLDLFQYPTLRDLAAYVEARSTATAPTATAQPTNDFDRLRAGRQRLKQQLGRGRRAADDREDAS